MATFWRTFHHEGKISPAWRGWEMHAQPLSLYLPPRAKLWCTLQLRGQIHSPYFSSTPIYILWCTLSDIIGKLSAKDGFSITNNIKQRCGVRLKHIRLHYSLHWLFLRNVDLVPISFLCCRLTTEKPFAPWQPGDAYSQTDYWTLHPPGITSCVLKLFL